MYEEYITIKKRLDEIDEKELIARIDLEKNRAKIRNMNDLNKNLKRACAECLNILQNLTEEDKASDFGEDIKFFYLSLLNDLNNVILHHSKLMSMVEAKTKNIE